jgi:nucleotide-binding universal stress UspA family protein
LRDANVLVTAGSAAPRILESAKMLDADLIVLATHGGGLMRRAFLGSVAEAVIRDSEIPVMSIRCGKRAPDLTFRRIVCAVNYTGVSGRAFAHAIALASAFGATLAAVYIIEQGGADVDEEAERLRVWTRNDTVAVEPRILVARRNASTILLEDLKESAPISWSSARADGSFRRRRPSDRRPMPSPTGPDALC